VGTVRCSAQTYFSRLGRLTQTITKIDHQLEVYHSPVPVGEGPLLRRFFNRQVDLLDESLVVGKDRFVLGDYLLDRLMNTGPDGPFGRG